MKCYACGAETSLTDGDTPVCLDCAVDEFDEACWFVALARALAARYEKETGKAAAPRSAEWKRWLDANVFDRHGGKIP